MLTDASERSPAGHEVEDEHNNGEDKKDVNPTAQGVAADESYYPEDEKNNGDGPKHCRSPKRSRFGFSGSQNGVQLLAVTCGKVPGPSVRLPVRIK